MQTPWRSVVRVFYQDDHRQDPRQGWLHNEHMTDFVSILNNLLYFLSSVYLF